MVAKGSIYNFKSTNGETIESIATDAMKNISKLYVDKLKKMLDRNDIKLGTSLVGTTVEEKVIIKMDFDNAKIKHVDSINGKNLRLITLEPADKDAQSEFEIVDSITNDNINNTSRVCTTIITNGTFEGTTKEEFIYLIDLFASHMLNIEFFNRGINALIGDNYCINGIDKLEINRFSCSELYLSCCIILANMGIVQLCTSDDVTYQDYIDALDLDEESQSEFPEYLWDAIAKSNYDIGNVEDDTIVRYISELLQKERDSVDESGEYGITEDIDEYNPVDDFIEYDKSDGYAEGEEE